MTVTARLRIIAGLITLFLIEIETPAPCVGETPNMTRVASDYAETAKPRIASYCLKCHSTKKMEGDLDLERFASLDDVRKEVAVWLKVAEMLDTGEMPPKGARKIPAQERQALRGWLAEYLKSEAIATAGDPGPVVMRRLSNAQYKYTLTDLTGVPLDPAREFPVDGAAGEGFTNTGNALVMSPGLLAKYFDAAKGVAAHAVPLPDGIRFSAGTTRRDWTNEIIERIRALYALYTDSGGKTEVNLQGIVFGTNGGGRLPLERYLAATLEERDSLSNGAKTVEVVGRERSLSPKYLGQLWSALNRKEASPLLDEFRARWRTAGPSDVAAMAQEIARWQSRLWKFNSVGHIGKVGGPKAWMEPVSPLLTREEFRVPLASPSDAKELRLYLVSDEAGDGSEADVVVWERPRLVAPGMPDLPLRDLAKVSQTLAERRKRVFEGAERSLAAASEAIAAKGAFDPAELSKKHGVPPDVLATWFEFLGLGASHGSTTIDSHLEGKLVKSAGYDFVNGWGSGETPNMLTNSSDTHVRVPGNLRPHSVAMHPSPTLRVAAGWLSPASGVFKVSGKVQHAHPECGNGVTWSLEVRRGSTRQRLAAGVSKGGTLIPIGPFEGVPIRIGDLVSLVIGPKNGNHACDMTAVDLTLSSEGKTWDLAADVSPDVLAGNPHADRLGNASVWHFYTEPDRGGEADTVIPAGSVLARWQSATSDEQRRNLARDTQALLSAGPPAAKESPDAKLYRELASLRGTLLRGALSEIEKIVAGKPTAAFGAARFGSLPDGQKIDAASLGVKAPAVVEVTIPAELADGCEFVTSGLLHSSSRDGSVQLSVTATKPGPRPKIDPARPVVVSDSGPARERFAKAFDGVRQLFPAALCYVKIVPVDEVVTLTLFHREDDHLKRLMLDDAQAARLDRLWSELRFVSQDALTLVDALQQLLEYASQDGDPKIFEPLKKPYQDRANAFRKALVDAEPKQIDAVIAFAERAYRHPLAAQEIEELRGLYRKLRAEELPHDDAWRLLLARILVSPEFLYRVETAGPGTSPTPISDWELASRLSYFLWSSAPDDDLRALAASGRLRDPQVLAEQARRMLKDDKIRRLATEFACQWLHVYDFDSLDEKSERHFPSFKTLRGAMYEETILFFADFFRRDRPALDFLDANFTFVNQPLAEFYGIPGVSGEDWRRVRGITFLRLRGFSPYTGPLP